MENFNTALSVHFKRYLNSLSVPLADRALFGEEIHAPATQFKNAAARLTQALFMPRIIPIYQWQQAAERLQQAQPLLSPWQGALAWQTTLGRLQQGLAGEDALLPETLLDDGDAEDLLGLPGMPDSEDGLFDFGDAELDDLFAETDTAPATSAPAAVVLTSRIEPKVDTLIVETVEADIDDEDEINAVMDSLAQEAVVAPIAEPVIDANGSAFFIAPDSEADSRIHVPAGQSLPQAAQLAAAAPLGGVNPILAATQQALRTAQATAATQTPLAEPPAAADPQTLSSREFFSNLPWQGVNSSE